MYNCGKSVKFLLSTLLTLVFLFATFSCKQQPDAIDNHNRPIHLSDYRGKWLIVNYWATWCAPCLTELPELNKLHQQHSNKLQVLAVNFDGLAAAQTADFTNPLQLQFPLLNHFPKEKFGITDIAALPTTFLISPQGQLLKTLHGPQTEQSIWEEISS